MTLTVGLFYGPGFRYKIHDTHTSISQDLDTIYNMHPPGYPLIEYTSARISLDTRYTRQNIPGFRHNTQDTPVRIFLDTRFTC